jgi:ParB family chromosome partitioning protein
MQRTKANRFLDAGRVAFVPVADIRPNPAQPRRVFDEAGLRELAASVAEYGVLQPLTVRKVPGGYELVAGERRLRAAVLAGLRTVPCLAVSATPEESGMLALVENLQRRDLDFIEEAEGLLRLMRQYNLSQEQAAQRVGKSQSAVANKLRLLRLPPEVLDALRGGGLTERHARALLKLPESAAQLRAARLAAAGGWTVAKTEQYVASLLRPAPPQKRELGPFVLRDVRVFLNAVQHQLELVQSAGVAAGSDRRETENEIILTIRIEKTGNKVRSGE